MLNMLLFFGFAGDEIKRHLSSAHACLLTLIRFLPIVYQLIFACSKLTIKALEKGVNYV